MGFARDIAKVRLSKSIPTAVFHCTNVLFYSNTISWKLTKSQGHVFLCSIQPKPTGTGSNDVTNYSNFTNWMGRCSLSTCKGQSNQHYIHIYVVNHDPKIRETFGTSYPKVCILDKNQNCKQGYRNTKIHSHLHAVFKLDFGQKVFQIPMHQSLFCTWRTFVLVFNKQKFWNPQKNPTTKTEH